MTLADKYRPTDWHEYVGQDKAVSTIRRIIERPDFDRGAFWIDAGGANNSGVGKSALARLIAGKLAIPYNVRDLTADECGIEFWRQLDADALYCAMSSDPARPFRVVIVNEAHALSGQSVTFLLGFLERIPRNLVLIFTTTREVDEGLFGDDAGPFASRTVRVRLTNQGLAQAFAARLLDVAKIEGLAGRATIDDAIKIVRGCKNNLRAALGMVYAGALLDGGES